MSYCDYVKSPQANPLHKEYHDNFYGFPVDSDDALFERLVLEINQAGLSWETILKRQDEFRRAYHNFSLTRVAAYAAEDIERLMQDSGIIRHRKKIEAAIHNARIIVELQKKEGSFVAWLDRQVHLSKDEWIGLFRKTFRFTGPEITNEFLMSTGYLGNSHDPDCPVLGDILRRNPPFMRKSS